MSASAAVLTGIRLFAWTGFLVMAWRLSLHDWRVQKIPHRELRVGAGLVVCAYALLALDTVLGLTGRAGTYFNWNFYRDLLLHLILSAVAALGLWRVRVWPAGDAKLFLLLGALAPLLTVEPNFLSGRYFLAALINVFLPACLFVFVEVTAYVWHTRLKHAAGFLIQAGARRAWDMAREGAARSVTDGAGAARKWIDLALKEPGAFALRLLSMGAMFVAMIGFSAAAHSVVPSGTARSALTVLVLYVVMKGEKSLGQWLIGAGAIATIVAYALAPAGGAFRKEFTEAAGSLTVFTLFLQFGAMWTMSLLGGQVPKAILPFSGIVIALGLTVVGSVGSVFARFTPLLTLALMGVFFGLCHVFVRIWEDEDMPQIPLDKLKAYMLPHRSFLEKAGAEDPDFIERHFGDVYADGMTARQARAARGWARRQGLETVPIQTTMSFAFWIFLGYFLTWAIGGSLLERVL
jgi:hypothetical protein